MPNSCCVPGCKSNYYKGEYVPSFAFPTEESRRNLWIKKIPRENFKITKNSVVCIAHFPEDVIVRELRVTAPDGKFYVIEHLKLYL